MDPGRVRALAWIAVPFAAYLFVLQRLWFDAPVSDDFRIVLEDVMRMADARSPGQWLAIAVAQHNEHRVAVTRTVAWAMAAVCGHVDFRALVLLGNLAVAGICGLAWLEFRGAVAAPVFGAAAALMFQWTYYEAALMPSAALANLGVVFFSFASLFFAVRGTVPAAAACVLFALLAAGSQGNGLFALPLAAAACAIAGRRRRAALFGAVAVALWIAYFWQYGRPAHHPPPLGALRDPLSAARYFMTVVGGIVPGGWASVATGPAILAALAWATRKGAWREHPAAGLWIAFTLLSAAAATVGRVGLGVDQAQSSRYAVYSTCLAVVSLLAVASVTRPWSRARTTLVVLASVAGSLIVSSLAWVDARSFSRAGQLLFKAVPASADVAAEPYLWTFSGDPAGSRRLLAEAARRGLYAPAAHAVHGAALRTTAAIDPAMRSAGEIGEVRASSSRVIVGGWTPIPAVVPARTMHVIGEGVAPALASFEVTGRPDVAMLGRDARLLSSGFRAELEYPSAEAARRAAEVLCIGFEAPGHAPVLLARPNGRCRPVATR